MTSVAIVGGGPAGIAAGHALHRAGVPFELFDAGPPLPGRRHDRAQDLGVGVGGAGLFSDGKFSFFPSGTHLYTLPDRARLKAAFGAVADMLACAGIGAPAFPDDDSAADAATPGPFRQKAYPSLYGSLEQRIRLAHELTAGYAARIRSFCTVEDLSGASGEYRIRYRNEAGRLSSQTFTHVVIATGRFGALGSLLENALPLEEQRYEVGIRIEHPNEVGFLRTSSSPDVKLIMEGRQAEVRTFCTCRNGEVWLIPYEPVSALSGRSDGPPSGYSNFGLLPRFSGTSRRTGRAIWQHFWSRFANSRTALWQPLPEFLNGTIDARTAPPGGRPWHPREDFVRGDIARALHPELCDTLAASLRAMVECFPDMHGPETICLFPAVEGVGRFPASGGDLRIGSKAAWVCGDVVGRFRGLVPALVSGHYVGRAVAAHVSERRLEVTGAPAE
jgi:uncharacterized FAD-dependent dehydrogenase